MSSPVPPTEYVRPPIESPVFRDADGRVIEYGRRWTGSPPEETYSVCEHPERFAPLHPVAEALIAHLRDTYDVEATEGEQSAPELKRPKGEVARAVTLRPGGAVAPAMTIVFTEHPGIFVQVEPDQEFAFPFCGCDACDSTWEADADQLESTVLGIAAAWPPRAVPFSESRSR